MANLSQNIEAITRYLLPDLLWGSLTDPQDELLKRIQVTGTDYDKVQYDQWDSTFGLTAYRGLGNSPPVVKYPNFKRYTMDPGYWGEKSTLDETTITSSRQPGTLADPLVVQSQTEVIVLHHQARLCATVRQLVADVIRTGRCEATGATGSKFSYQIDNYSSQQLSPAIPWKSSASIATPITDLIGFQAGLQKGTSSKFGVGGVLLGNSFSIQDFFNTTQIQQTYKSRYGASIIGLDGVPEMDGLNKIMTGFDLSPIVRYDEGYYLTQAAAAARDKTQWVYTIPSGCLLWIGTRDGGQQQVGEFQLTRHAGLVETAAAKTYPNADGILEKWSGPTAIEKGLYVRAHYNNSMPHGYDVELGINGSPLIGYPSAVAVITWT